MRSTYIFIKNIYLFRELRNIRVFQYSTYLTNQKKNYEKNEIYNYYLPLYFIFMQNKK